MVWLVFGIPLASFGVGGGLVVQAVRAGGAEELTDADQNVSQVQATDPAAHPSGLLAVIRVADGVVEVLPASNGFDEAAPLNVTFTNPSRTQANLQLQPIAHGWRAQTQIDNSLDWRVQLSSADGHWQLLGDLPPGQQSTRLTPAPGNKHE
jgi:hypothetical protein